LAQTFEKKQDLSVYYWLQSFLNPMVKVVDAFPVENLVLPSVSIETDVINGFFLELGSGKQEQIRTWTVDVFALNKTQRDEIGYLIYNELDNKIPVYDYDEGFPPAVNSQTQLGILDMLEKKLKTIRVYPELVDTLYYRCEITFSTLYRSF
jgi:hypothetical protein